MEAFEGIALSMGASVVNLDNVIIQAPLAVSILEGNGFVDEFKEIRNGWVVGQRHVEEDVILG